MMTLAAYLAVNIQVTTPQGVVCQVKPLANLTPYMGRYYAARRLLAGPVDRFYWLLILALLLTVWGLLVSAPLIALSAAPAVVFLPAMVGAVGGLLVASTAGLIQFTGVQLC